MQNKMARICWNTNDWKRPSGSNGKSTSKATYEFIHGFGHEEWLFDFEKTINGFHYGYLTPIRKSWGLYQGKTLNILLYTYNRNCENWYWVGWLRNAQVITKAEAKEICREYKQRGWLDTMRKEIIACGANPADVDRIGISFNIRFLPTDVTRANDGCELFSRNQIMDNKRYMLLNYASKFGMEK
ncbi:MAG: hypothetical protein Ta2A_18990 [Treponemataceae bacterium]|nr:MAG: hypothetical protein Ta2A_18990 [Treponemataceae bacterium]